MPQDQNLPIQWPHDMHPDSMGAGIGDEDFTKFLDLDNGFEQYQQLESEQSHSSLETPMGRLVFGQDAMQDITSHNTPMMQEMDITGNRMEASRMFAQRTNLGQDGVQHYNTYPMYQQIDQIHHYRVPPTPVSAEMHAAKYIGHVENAGQILFDRHQASFTPLVSPAQTPLENAFSMPDYVVADEFFSPLTSPAIEAQPSFASTNATASPIDLNSDQSVTNTAGSGVRKRARKANLPQQRPHRSIRESPAMKPQTKRRQFSINSLSQDKLEAMFEQHRQDIRLQPESSQYHVFASSEDSVSPEPLSEALMRPPPVPSSTTRSPIGLRPQNSEQNLPATPAMIMRMPSKQGGSSQHSANQTPVQSVLEDITLPDAVGSFSSVSLSHIDTKLSSMVDQSTPTLSAKTPVFGGESTPRTSALKLTNNSNESVDKIKKPEVKPSGRGSKKRPNITSATISPALRPKISPSISPLAPATSTPLSGLSAETSALFLASKSNYQNILDGTHLPGVSYPEALAENLSSKRTSHKIAEQGRRNRINVALKEIETLLPPSITVGIKKEKSGSSTSKDNEDGSPDKPGSANQNASKASTVEMAIVYIKNLQAELEETKQKLEAAEKQIAAGSSNGSQTSE